MTGSKKMPDATETANCLMRIDTVINIPLMDLRENEKLVYWFLWSALYRDKLDGALISIEQHGKWTKKQAKEEVSELIKALRSLMSAMTLKMKADYRTALENFILDEKYRTDVIKRYKVHHDGIVAGHYLPFN